MRATTQLPVWLVVVLTLAPAVIAATAAATTAWLAGARKAARQLDHWRRREETMRMLRWAADKATSADDDEALMAVSVLAALASSKPTMLQPEDQGILDAVLDVVLTDATAAVEEYGGPSGDYEAEVTYDG